MQALVAQSSRYIGIVHANRSFLLILVFDWLSIVYKFSVFTEGTNIPWLNFSHAWNRLKEHDPQKTNWYCPIEHPVDFLYFLYQF